MTAKRIATAPADSAPCPRPISAEITPAEFDHYMKKAQAMRAETTADILDRCAAALGRLFARAKPAPRRREPILVKPARSRPA